MRVLVGQIATRNWSKSEQFRALARLARGMQVLRPTVGSPPAAATDSDTLSPEGKMFEKQAVSQRKQKVSTSDLQAEIQRLKAENETLRQRSERKLSLKVSEKGAVSLYGLRRFPVTFYAAEWERIHAAMPSIAEFIAEHADELTSK